MEAASREVCLDGGCLEGGCLDGGCLDPPPARPGGRAARPAPPGEAVVGGGGRGGELCLEKFFEFFFTETYAKLTFSILERGVPHPAIPVKE